MTGPRIRAAGVLICVFALGVFGGMAYERHSGRHLATMSVSDEHEAAMVEMREVLDLDDAQIEQIHGILARHQDVVQHMWEQLRPEVQSAMQQVHTEIADLLRPHQRELFHEWLTSHFQQSQTERGH